MSKKTTLLFKSVLIVLKNATIIIPLIEGVINTIYGLCHPDEQKEEKKDGRKLSTVSFTEIPTEAK